jgi:hypothetical protein
MLLSKQEVLTKKLFGTGKVHPRFEEFWGDYLAIAISDVSILNPEKNLMNLLVFMQE